MAKTSQPSTAAAQATPTSPDQTNPPATVKARVLADCAYGNCGDVVDVDPAVAANCLLLDPHPAAVAYALSLPQNQPTAADAAAA